MLALKPGGHLCLIYEHDPMEQMPALLPYFQQGLKAGDRCIYVADDQSNDELSRAFIDYGIDFEAERECGALQLWSRDQWRQEGELDSHLKSEQVRSIIASALSDGFKGVRFAVEMTWTLGPTIDHHLLRVWEAMINSIFTPDTPGRIVCQYSMSRLTPEAIEVALVTHPIAVLDQDVCPNPFYAAPLIIDGGGEDGHDADGRRVDWMLSQLRRARAFEKERVQRRQAEEAAHQAEQARRRMEELYNIAHSTAEDLRRAHRMKDDFLGLISHELRTPLTTIYGNARLLRRHATRLGQEERDAAISDIEQEAGKLQSIIENLLVLARFENEQGLETEPLLLSEQVAQIVDKFHQRAPDRKVIVSLATDLPPIASRAIYLELVLTNLLSNAHKYSPPAEPIELTAQSSHGRVTVSVRDYGVGLPQEDIEELFEPFRRSGQVLDVADGIGIGLATCKRIVEAHGCSIWAERADGKGSVFRFSLPDANSRPH